MSPRRKTPSSASWYVRITGCRTTVALLVIFVVTIVLLQNSDIHDADAAVMTAAVEVTDVQEGCGKRSSQLTVAGDTTTAPANDPQCEEHNQLGTKTVQLRERVAKVRKVRKASWWGSQLSRKVSNALVGKDLHLKDGAAAIAMGWEDANHIAKLAKKGAEIASDLHAEGTGPATMAKFAELHALIKDNHSAQSGSSRAGRTDTGDNPHVAYGESWADTGRYYVDKVTTWACSFIPPWHTLILGFVCLLIVGTVIVRIVNASLNPAWILNLICAVIGVLWRCTTFLVCQTGNYFARFARLCTSTCGGENCMPAAEAPLLRVSEARRILEEPVTNPPSLTCTCSTKTLNSSTELWQYIENIESDPVKRIPYLLSNETIGGWCRKCERHWLV